MPIVGHFEFDKELKISRVHPHPKTYILNLIESKFFEMHPFLKSPNVEIF